MQETYSPSSCLLSVKFLLLVRSGVPNVGIWSQPNKLRRHQLLILFKQSKRDLKVIKYEIITYKRLIYTNVVPGKKNQKIIWAPHPFASCLVVYFSLIPLGTPLV